MIHGEQPEAMRGQNVICFAKDWDEDPTSNNHVMKLLARDNKVLWINSISTRTPSFSNRQDLTKIWRKLKSLLRRPRQVERNLWVYTPIVLPFPHSKFAVRINQQILRTSLKILRRRLGMSRFQLWTFLPNAVEYVGRLEEELVVYYCIDEWSKFQYLAGDRMYAFEQRLCPIADVVFATAQSLVHKRAPMNPQTHLASHGVDYAHFASALDEGTRVADELRQRQGPVLGFFGLLHEWIDQDLLEYLASRHPEWTILLIGKAVVDVSRFDRFPNVLLTGRKEYAELPRYCKGMDVGLIPFAVNELTRAVNPIKLREYMSAGLPVVSTALPEVSYCSEECVIAKDYAAFEQGILEVLRTDSPDARRQRSQSMQAETWENKVARIGATVMRVRAEKMNGRR